MGEQAGQEMLPYVLLCLKNDFTAHHRYFYLMASLFECSTILSFILVVVQSDY